MAEVIGAPGISAQEEASRRLRRKVLAVYAFVFFTGFYAGWVLAKGRKIGKSPYVLPAGIGALVFIGMLSRSMDKHDRAERNWRAGADGEVLVAALLARLPDEFVVINDIPKRFGNIDHVVIGPTGLFLLNTKNWRGKITANGAGELLINDRKTDHPEVRNLARAAMNLHDKVSALCDKEFFVQGVMVFVRGTVNADFAATKPVHCLPDERLLAYLDNGKYAGRLAVSDVQRIKTAVLGIASMNGGISGPQPV